MSTKMVLRIGLFSLVAASAAWAYAAEESVNLVGHSGAALVRSTPIVKGEWHAAHDGSPASEVRLRGDGQTVEIVLKASDTIATAESWTVTLGKKAPPVRAEILASTTSDRNGFSLLRGDELSAKKNSGRQLSFRARGVKYLLLRFALLDAKQDSLSIAEVAVNGRLSAPETKYAFTESPARALDVLASLKMSDQLMIAVTRDEENLFADARDGKLDDWSLAEAMLLASGVTEKGARAKLLAQIDRLEQQAAKAIAGKKTAFDRGDALLRWLHRENGTLAGGYKSHQTRLDVLLEKKTFNCVSSAAIYAILARRLGLDARAIEVPDHAFAIVYDGSKHADVETTNARGFNPARDRAAQKAFEQQTGLSYIPDSHRDKRREIDATGLVAITYYNRGVMLTDDDKHHAALLAYFRAMSMDAEFNSAVKNALAGLVNWGNELLEAKRYDVAVNVIETGLSLAPKDASLRHNQEVAYSKWAVSLAEKDDSEQALKVLRTAAKASPEGDFVSMQSWIFTSQGEKEITAKRWREALEVADNGLAAVDEGAKKNLHAWRTGVLLRWSNDRHKAKDFAASLKILEEAIETAPKDRRFLKNMAYVVQEWASHLQKTKNAEAAREMLIATAAKHSQLPDVQKVAANFARNGYIELRDAGKLEAADQWIAENAALLAEKDAVNLRKDLWQAITRKPIVAKDWREAESVLGRAIERFPNEGRFQQNLAFVIQNLANDLLENQGAKDAREELISIRKRYEKHSRVQRAMEGVIHSAVAKALAKGDPQAAWDCCDHLRGVLPENRDAVLVRTVADQLAGPLHKAKKWQNALSIYEDGLRRLPDDRHLKNNSQATWHAWARISVDAKQWEAAIAVYEKALKQFPDERSFKQNIDYCQHQLKQQ